MTALKASPTEPSAQEFWNSTKLWPLVPPEDGVVFLAAAMHRLARAYFEDWHGREPWFPSPPDGFLPRDLDRHELVYLRQGRHLIRLYSAGIKPIPLGTWEVWRPSAAGPADEDTRPLTNDEWEKAFEIADELRNFSIASRKRWNELVEATFAFLKYRRLESVLQPFEGGEYVEAPDALWNSDLAHTIGRFDFCRVDLARPFGVATLARSRPHLIYVRTATLDRLVTDISALKGGGDKIVPAPRSPVNAGRFKARVMADVKRHIKAPPEDWSRDRYIEEVGYEEMRLPKSMAKALFAEALRDVAAEGIDHSWSKRRPSERSRR